MSKASEYAKIAKIHAPNFSIGVGVVTVNGDGDLVLDPGEPHAFERPVAGLGHFGGGYRAPRIIKATDVPAFIKWLQETFID